MVKWLFISSFLAAFTLTPRELISKQVVCGRKSLALFLVIFILLPITLLTDAMSDLSTCIIQFTISYENLRRIIDLGTVLLQISALEVQEWLNQRAFDATIHLEQTSTKKTCLLQKAQKTYF